MSLDVTFYTRKNCSLCDEAKELLDHLQAEIPHTLAVVDIDEDPDLVALYGEKVPVVAVGPYKLQAPFDERKLRMTLGAAQDSQAHQQNADEKGYSKKKKRRDSMSAGDRLSHFISGRYLLVIQIVLFLYAGLPFLAPVLMKAGVPKLAQPIYSMYKVSCHELAFRSWFLFGEQPVYPRESAGVEGFIPYGQATGLNENDLVSARNFVGNEELGYKVAFCQRDIAIYVAMFLFGIVFALSGRKIKPLPMLAWVLIGILPIGLDGGSQLLSQMFTWIPYRESTPLLRTLTGTLFGIMTAWFGFPVFEETMRDTRMHLAAKRARLQNKPPTD
ncbi:MAG TPA: DUF2085 domain-containing protein [Anaerolineales bacterium]|nr:DUF2085 domain-containing protein [Anaerolineales bacterium]